MDLQHTILEIVKDIEAQLDVIINQILYYNIKVGESLYQLEIDCSDEEWKDVPITPKYKSITLMRWIRKGMSSGKLIQMH